MEERQGLIGNVHSVKKNKKYQIEFTSSGVFFQFVDKIFKGWKKEGVLFVLFVMDPGQFETPWNEYTNRMDPDKYNKFAECFHGLIEGTNVNEAESMVTVGIGEWDRYDYDLLYLQDYFKVA